MMRNQFIIWLTIVIYAGPVGCFPSVICYGDDGHILLENPYHNHCQCPQGCTCETIHSECLCIKHNHHHCSDLPLNLTMITVTPQTNNETDDANLDNIHGVDISADQASIGELLPLHNSEIDSYFSPLHTIILQA
jgi:hypothetical protein